MTRAFELVAKVPRVNVAEGEFAFQCKALKLPTVKEQYLFASRLGRKFTADFAFIEYELLIEIQGGVWRPAAARIRGPATLSAILRSSNTRRCWVF